MELTWYGLSCFRMTERGNATVVTDPYNGKVGLPALKLKADVVTVSHDAPGHNHLDSVSGYRRALNGPGEYEVGGVFITGVATAGNEVSDRNVLYQFNFSGLRVAHLGDIAKVPTQSQVEALGTVHVLLLPVGGGNSLNATEAAELVSTLEPRLVVPMHYAIDGQKVKLDTVDRFLKEMGVTDVQEEATLKVTASSLPEDTQTVILTPKS